MGDKGSSKGWYGVDEAWHQLKNKSSRNLRRLKKKLNKAA